MNELDAVIDIDSARKVDSYYFPSGQDGHLLEGGSGPRRQGLMKRCDEVQASLSVSEPAHGSCHDQLFENFNPAMWIHVNDVGWESCQDMEKKSNVRVQCVDWRELRGRREPHSPGARPWHRI